MTKEESQEVSFYLGDEAQRILQDDRLSDEEKRVVRAAVLTARKEKPNMQLIYEANMVLKTVSKSKPSINATGSQKSSPEALAKIEMMSITARQKNASESKGSIMTGGLFRGETMVRIAFLLAIGGSAVVYKYMSASPLHTFEEAKDICQEQGKVMPNSWENPNQFFDTEENKIGYWNANGTILFNVLKADGKNDGKEHYVVCVDKEKSY